MDKLELKNLNKELEIIGVESVNYLRQILSENNKYASGDLIKSLDFQIIKNIDTLMLKILASDHFKYVDEGRKKGKMPPTKPIEKWIKQKNLKFGKMNSKQSSFVVARSIGKKGIKPMNLISKLNDNILSRRLEILKNATQEDIQDLIDKIFYSNK